jgi:hypothetical protein
MLQSKTFSLFGHSPFTPLKQDDGFMRNLNSTNPEEGTIDGGRATFFFFFFVVCST